MAELADRIRQLVNGSQLAVFATVTPDGKPWARYVMANADEDLTIRFATHLSSRKVAQIRECPEVHLTCGVISPAEAEHFVQVQGRAEISTTDAERDAQWYDHLSKYFRGPRDPNYCVLIVKPYRIEYATMTAPQPEVWEAP